MAENLIIDPRTGDKERVEDMLDELCAVLRKRGYILQFDEQRGAMAIAKVEPGFGMNVRVLAHVRKITGASYDYQTIDWSAKPGRMQ